MKTIFNTITGIAMLFFICGQAVAQDVLRFGVTPNNPVVVLPFFYWDLLHTSAEGWTLQYYNTNNTPNTWSNYEKSINLKNSNGQFTEVTTLNWNSNTKKWENSYKNLYSYINDVNNKPVVVTWEKDLPSYNGAVRFENTFEQGLLTEMTVNFKNGGSFFPYTHILINYDAAGNRVLDSGVNIQSSTPNYKSFYEYDNQHHCTKESYWALSNNVLKLQNYSVYTYNTGGKLETTNVFNIDNVGNDEQIAGYNFTYTPAGNIDVATIYQLNATTNSMEPDEQYKHYYNSQNKLIAMVSRFYNNTGKWTNSDSFVFNYLPSGAYDTAYIFSGDAASTWETTPAQRLVFDAQTSTGIGNTTKPLTTIKAYPNPTTNTLFVEFDALTTQTTHVTLADITGKVVKTQPIQLFAGQTTTIQMFVEDVAAGIYTLKAGNTTIKIVKQ
jgi:hypothetical protein